MANGSNDLCKDENSNPVIMGRILRRNNPETTKRKIKELSVLGKIGKGSFGEVFLVEHQATREQYALKQMTREKEGSETKKLQDSEWHLMSAIQCPFVVKLFDHWEDEDKVFLLMEYLPGGDLFVLLNKMGRMSEEQTKFYIAQIVLALEHLHNLDIIYRDLKPENILLDSSGYIKIIDFGFAKQTEPGKRCVTLCGTPEYLAPEVFLGRGYTSAVDFWALGILTWELVAGTAPWSTMRRDKWRQIVVYEAILGGLPAFPEHFSEELNKFLTALLQKKPEERLGAWGAKKEEWLADTLWEQLWSTSLEPPSSICSKIEQSSL